MPVARIKKVELNKRRERVADLYLHGKTQIEISEIVGVKQPTISQDLKKIQKQWRESAVRDFDLAREMEIQKIDRVEREAWAAWERSKLPSQAATTTDGEHDRKTRRHVKNQCGDPRFLEQVNKCTASRRALLSLDAPTRMEVETDAGTLVERRSRVFDIFAALRDRAGIGSPGELPGDVEPRLLCSDSEPGTVDTSETPRLSG